MGYAVNDAGDLRFVAVKIVLQSPFVLRYTETRLYM